MARRRGGNTITEEQKKHIAQQYLNESIPNLGLSEAYTDLLRGIMAPLYARQPIVSPIDFDGFTNPMWSVYEREISVSAERNKRLKDYADMDEDSIISTALDIYASEACQYSDEHGATVWVTSQDPMVIEESHRLFQQTEYEDYIEGICRDAAKCGDDFVGALYNFRDGVVRLKFVEPDEVTIRTDKYGRLTAYRYQDSKKDIEPWNFVHYKNIGKKQSAKRGGSVYGTAMIEPARRIWRQMRMMEDALVIWRMDIGTRRLVFYVDVGNLGQEEAMKAVRDWERAYKKKPYFNPCLVGTTGIPLLDGTEPTIQELAESGIKQFWVYSHDRENSRIVPGLASNPRKTGEKVPVWKITYDDSAFDVATWNHPFRLRDGRDVSLGDLRVGDSLMPLYRDVTNQETARSMFGPSGYEILCQPNGKWEYTHRSCAPDYPCGLREQSSSRRVVLHHHDFNRFNNEPSNLKWMTWEDHSDLHQNLGKRMGPVNIQHAIAWKRSDEGRRICSEFFVEWWERNKHRKTETGQRLVNWNTSEDGRLSISDHMKRAWSRQEFRDQRDKSNFEPHDPSTDGRFGEVFDAEVQSYAQVGFKAPRIADELGCDVRVVRRRMSNLGIPLNHSIVSIEFHGYEDVYNFDVDIYENFATSSGVFVHNSTGEFISRHSPLALDNHIFWPIRPTSRSRVEYIGGDTNVSAVADVDYFRRKMAAALKIPMAYLGGDEYAAVRTGLAQMDVYFARCVKKLQRSMIRGTLKLLLTHLRLREVPYSQDDVRVNMEPISGIEEMQRIEALTAAVNLAQMMFMTGTAMGIPPNLWVPYILKDILRISDEDILSMPIDLEQIQQVQQLQAAGPEGPDGRPGAEPGGPDDGGPEGDQPPANDKDRAEGQRRELHQRIQEELKKGEYANLKQFLTTEADTDPGLLIPESDLIPMEDGRVPRVHKSQLRLN